ncbi:armadillo-type protein [Parasitella parasitica]|nr:armadillo-type protein [Parasitella parasitica]
MADLGFDFPDDDYEQDESLFEQQDDKFESDHDSTKKDKENQHQEQDVEKTLEPHIIDASQEYTSTDAEDTSPSSKDTTSTALIQTMSDEDELEDELLADENVTPIERVYGFNENDDLINRLLLAKELASALDEISLAEAVKDVLPIMDKLACDTDDTVKETFASELDHILLYFYKNLPAMFSHSDQTSTQEKTFAPLIIRILLDQNSGVASLGQQALVAVVTELRRLSDQDPVFQRVINCEIFKGVIEGLMLIVDGKKKLPKTNGQDDEEGGDLQGDEAEALKYHRVSIDDGLTSERRRSSATPGFETSLNVHHAPPSDDEFGQGEISLAKITCISLIASIVGVFNVESCTEKCLPIIQQLASDSLFYVRKEAATAIGCLAQVVDTKVAEEKLLPLFRQFAEDQIWHVRRSCVLTLPQLCGVLSEESKTELTVTSVETFRNDISRNVRNAMADIVGELVSKFLPEGWERTGHPGKIPEPLLQYFLSLGSNASNSNNQMLKLEIDRTYICAYNFPVVVLTAGADYWDTHLRDTYLGLTKDYQIKVRCTFAHSLHDIARIIGPELTERDLVQIFALYLMDLDDVKQGVLEHLADFLGTLAVTSRNEYIPILAEVWDGVSTNWHLRNILAAQLMEISMLFDASRVVEHILPLVVRACHDEFAAVRETGVGVFPVVLDVVKHAVEEDGDSLSQADGYGDDITENKRNFALALLSHVMERLDEFARSDNYRGRLVNSLIYSFAQICKALIEAGIGASDFASFFLPRLAPLAYDPVVNVRIAASRAIGTIYTNEPFRRELSEIAAPSRTVNQAGESGHALDQMTYRFALDKDSDVRSFVMPFVDTEILEKQREKEMQAAVQIAEAAIEARAEENNNYNDSDEDEDEDEDEEEGDDDDDESDGTDVETDNKLSVDMDESDEAPTPTPMQDVERVGSPEKDNTEPMDISTMLASAESASDLPSTPDNKVDDEDEIMSEAEPVALKTNKSTNAPSTEITPEKPTSATTAATETTTAIVLPCSSAMDDEDN